MGSLIYKHDNIENNLNHHAIAANIVPESTSQRKYSCGT